jgi:hypothetical protein
MYKVIDALNVSAPEQASEADRVEKLWQFLQGNFLLLFPISLFFLLATFAAVMAASP